MDMEETLTALVIVSSHVCNLYVTVARALNFVC